ncbi:class Ib ribonucleoside-diphosphate reductase assembly flavoprotein NrdI [Deinococcus cellulosilyticus]|uniref:Protein NrdI n=1 Tax=Deinococcus cellulosilyticus (strain DSM 18568 / NBRC 106333 / KACC 11606 / 5516J-15) TaxID=1223518 RepID=A0A511N4R2_DEIC1|nr:class Ib ribonucleoside-diphosphate reductase assembly flavoprotein NrdI [Deinococcus cellulosilyticus]GEM47854.1 protein NrdI [Deinococcus cellulosilyticus NBRC 106333 = KACC 11606]
MLLVYASKTGNTQRFVQKLGEIRSLRILTGEEQVDEPCILLTYTTGFGQVPPEVEQFVLHNALWIRGVAASGNRNWGTRFARSADVLSERLGVPVVYRFELSGRPTDVVHFRALYREIRGSQLTGTILK